jgi:sigma-B regulation protein RsbU (phosphoserine phosphatase)
LIPALLYCSLNHYIVNPIGKLTEIAKKIGKGEDIQIKIEKPEEFAQLASTFDKMTKDIKSVTQERAKINSELSIAKSIQSSSLPNVFPPFPNRKEFDIFASMEAAKEVGGDFYDFFFIDDTKFMFLIADVSGKGVPAALFMMTVKTLINNMAQMDYSPKQLIEIINNKICQTNKQGFFVTVLIGITSITTGKTTLINCGHNLPLIKR